MTLDASAEPPPDVSLQPVCRHCGTGREDHNICGTALICRPQTTFSPGLTNAELETENARLRTLLITITSLLEQVQELL